MTFQQLAVACLACVAVVAAAPLPTLPFSTIVLPAGFSISAYTNTSLPSARSLCLGSEEPSIVYLGTNAASVYALVDAENNGTVAVTTMLTGQAAPMGVAYANGSLFVSTNTAILRYDNANEAALAGQMLGAGTQILAFPNQPDHNAHYIAIGPDDRLYVNLGFPANIAEPMISPVQASNGTNITYGSIISLNLDGSDVTQYVSGIRNVVGMGFQPSTGSLWITNNGRDEIAPNNVTETTNTPDDWIAVAPEPNLNFGFPACDWQGLGDQQDRNVGPGTVLADPNVTSPAGANASPAAANAFCAASADPPVQAVGPHVATLGMKFYDPPVHMFPSNFTNNTIFNAQHGSWDRPNNNKIGYRVMTLNVDDDGQATSYQPFATGWLDMPTGNVWGRPADVAVLMDGSLLISDDQVGAVYRVAYSPTTTLATAVAGRRMLSS